MRYCTMLHYAMLHCTDRYTMLCYSKQCIIQYKTSYRKIAQDNFPHYGIENHTIISKNMISKIKIQKT